MMLGRTVLIIITLKARELITAEQILPQICLFPLSQRRCHHLMHPYLYKQYTDETVQSRKARISHFSTQRKSNIIVQTLTCKTKLTNKRIL